MPQRASVVDKLTVKDANNSKMKILGMIPSTLIRISKTQFFIFQTRSLV